jgi:hypothetical protein
MNRAIVTLLIAMSVAIAGTATALSDSVTGCDGKKYDLPQPKSYDECMANGRVLKCTDSQSTQFCSKHFSK